MNFRNVLVLSIVLSSFALFQLPNSMQVFASNQKYNIEVDVRVLDVDSINAIALIEMFIRLGPLPLQFNETAIIVQVLGGGYATVICSYTEADSFGRYFRGNFSSSWYFIGAGELFPFDYYFLDFELNPLIGEEFEFAAVKAIFHGYRQKSLMDTWETSDSINEIQYDIAEDSDLEFYIHLKRKWIAPFLTFILPSLFGYCLLGASLFMEPTTRIQEILTVYLSLFVFIPAFFIGIQSRLPYRSLLSIPEILLVNLITSLTLLCTSMMISQYAPVITVKSRRIPMEWFGLIAILVFFCIFYIYLYFPVSLRLPSMEAVIVFIIVVLSYFLGIFGYLLRLRRTIHRVRIRPPWEI